jgi:tryptophan synthase alpha chain
MPFKNRIAAAFQNARREKRAAFIAYICGGDPDFETSAAAAAALLGAGVDILEIGVPFSDPLADGLTNQLAALRALAGGMNRERLFALAGRVRSGFPDAPIVLYTYYNLILARGIAAFAADCREAGVDGVLTLDCPPEEAGELVAECRAAGVANIFIVSPTTPEERVKRIVADASGFIYYVSREGVTGERVELSSGLGSAITAIKQHTELPVVAGFGISTPEHVAEAGRAADGVVVGSALVNIIATHANVPDTIPAALATKVRWLLGQ